MGKCEAALDVPADSPEEFVEKTALSDDAVVKWIAGKQIVKKIFVKNRIINFVAE